MPLKLGKVFYLGVMFLLVACENQSAVQFVDGDKVPPSPSIFSYFTVDGSDADGDQLRDDIELWINEDFDDPNIRKAMKWRARTMLYFMKATTTQQALLIMEYERKADECLNFVFQYKVTDEDRSYIEKTTSLFRMILNNYWRKKKYNEIGKLVPSGVYEGSSPNILKQYKSCTFKVENPERLFNFFSDKGKFEMLTDEEKKEIFEILTKNKQR